MGQNELQSGLNPGGNVTLAIIGLAKGLSLKVVAEGVESNVQEEFLLANGCDIGQGFLYGKPMTFGELRSWLNNRLRLECVTDTVAC
jgi:EAL domain-containing protein (putative c-di-GMP-specific phosphodiesterase class I)